MAENIQDDEGKVTTKLEITQKELDAKLNKISEDTKNRIYPQIEKATKELEAEKLARQKTEDDLRTLSTKLEALETERNEAKAAAEKAAKAADDAKKSPDQKQLEKTQELEAKTDKTQSLIDELTKKLEEQEAAHKDALNKVSELASAEIIKLKLDGYKERVLDKAKLKPTFASRVTGDNEDEINASVLALKAEQDALMKEMEEEIAQKYKAKGIPTPLSIASGNESPAETDGLSHMDREALVHANPADFQAMKNKLLQKAIEKQQTN